MATNNQWTMEDPSPGQWTMEDDNPGQWTMEGVETVSPKTTVAPAVKPEPKKKAGLIEQIKGIFDPSKGTIKMGPAGLYGPAIAQSPTLRTPILTDVPIGAAERVPFVGGVASGIRYADILFAARRVRDNKGTDADYQKLLDFKKAIDADANLEKTWGYKVGEIVTQLPTFAVEFATTGGAFSAGKKLVLGGIEKALKNKAKSKIVAFAAKKIVAPAVGAAVQTAAMPQMILKTGTSKAVEKSVAPRLEKVDVSVEDVKKELTKAMEGFDDNIAMQLLKAYPETFVEVASERTGGLATAGLKKIKPVKNAFEAVSKWWAGKGRKTADLIAKIKTAAGWHGVIGEMFEERVADVAHTINQGIGIEEKAGAATPALIKMVTGEGGRAAAFKEFLGQVTAEGAAFAIPGATMAAANKALTRPNKLAGDLERGLNSDRLTPVALERIYGIIDNSEAPLTLEERTRLFRLALQKARVIAPKGPLVASSKVEPPAPGTLATGPFPGPSPTIRQQVGKPKQGLMQIPETIAPEQPTTPIPGPVQATPEAAPIEPQAPSAPPIPYEQAIQQPTPAVEPSLPIFPTAPQTAPIPAPAIDYSGPVMDRQVAVINAIAKDRVIPLPVVERIAGKPIKKLTVGEAQQLMKRMRTITAEEIQALPEIEKKAPEKPPEKPVQQKAIEPVPTPAPAPAPAKTNQPKADFKLLDKVVTPQGKGQVAEIKRDPQTGAVSYMVGLKKGKMQLFKADQVQLQPKNGGFKIDPAKSLENAVIYEGGINPEIVKKAGLWGEWERIPASRRRRITRKDSKSPIEEVAERVASHGYEISGSNFFYKLSDDAIAKRGLGPTEASEKELLEAELEAMRKERDELRQRYEPQGEQGAEMTDAEWEKYWKNPDKVEEPKSRYGSGVAESKILATATKRDGGYTVKLPNERIQTRQAMRKMREMGLVIQEVRNGWFGNWLTEEGLRQSGIKEEDKVEEQKSLYGEQPFSLTSEKAETKPSGKMSVEEANRRFQSEKARRQAQQGSLLGAGELFEKTPVAKEESKAKAKEPLKMHPEEFDKWMADERAKEKEWVDANLKAAGEADAVELRSQRASDRYVIIHRSMEAPGKWQASQFDDEGPWGHSTFNSREEAIRAFSGEHQKGVGLPYGGVGEWKVTRSKTEERQAIGRDLEERVSSQPLQPVESLADATAQMEVDRRATVAREAIQRVIDSKSSWAAKRKMLDLPSRTRYGAPVYDEFPIGKGEIEKAVKRELADTIAQTGLQPSKKDLFAPAKPKTKVASMFDAMETELGDETIEEPTSRYLAQAEKSKGFKDVVLSKPENSHDISEWSRSDRENYSGPIDETKFSTYVEPGGTNYKELFVTAPDKDAKRFKELEEEYRWPHRRRNMTQEDRAELEELFNQVKTWEDGHSDYSEIENPIVRLRFNDRTGPNGEKILFLEEMQPPSKENQAKMPSDLKNKWREIGMERAIRYGLENGYDRLAWTSGEMQAARYDLSKQVDEIEVTRFADGSGIVDAWKNGEVQIHKTLDHPVNWPSVVGKNLASKVEKQGYGDKTSYKGLDLSLGGEGLKRVYDEDLPNVAKRFGAKVEPMPFTKMNKASGSGLMSGTRITVPSFSLSDLKPLDTGYEVAVKESYEQPKQSRREILRGIEVREALPDDRGEVAAGRSRSGVSLLGLAITPQVRKGEWIDLRGKRIRDTKDVVAIGRLYRNPQFETIHTLYVKDGLIVAHEAVSSRLPGVSNVFVEYPNIKGFYRAKSRAERLKADGIYLIHNHPSGDVETSAEDRKATRNFGKMFGETFKGHIVVDHETFSFIDGDGIALEKLQMPATTKDLIHEPAVPYGGLGEKIIAPTDLAAWGKVFALPSPENVTIIYRSKTQVGAVEAVPKALFLNAKEFTNWLRGRAREYGAMDAFAYYSNSRSVSESLIMRNAMRGYVKDGTLRDGISEGFDSAYNSMSDKPDKSKTFGLTKEQLRKATTRIREEESPYGNPATDAFADHPTWKDNWERVQEELQLNKTGLRRFLPRRGEAKIPGQDTHPVLFWRSPANVLSRMGGKYAEISTLITEADAAKHAKQLPGHFYGMQHFDDIANEIIKTEKIHRNSDEDHMVRDLLDEAYTGLTAEKLRQSVAYNGDKEAAIRAADRMRDEIFEPIIQHIRGDKELVKVIGKKGYIRGYFPHYMAQMEKKYGPKEAVKMIRALLPERFVSKFLNERESDNWASGVSVYDVVPSYIASTMKTIHDIPAYDKARKLVNELPKEESTWGGEGTKDFAQWYISNYMGVQSKILGMFDPQSFLMRASGKVAGLYYDNLIGLNWHTWAVNTMQTVSNTYPELGAKNIAKGVWALATDKEARQKFHDSGLLLDKPGMDLGVPIHHRFRKIVHAGMAATEYLNRGIAYLGALEQAKDMGLAGKSAELHAADVVDKTQFSYGPKGQSRLLASVPPDWRVFQTFRAKELEFVRNMIADAYTEIKEKKEYGPDSVKLARFLVINAGLAAALQAGGAKVGRWLIELWDLIPWVQLRTVQLVDKAYTWSRAAWKGVNKEYLGAEYPKGTRIVKPERIPEDIIFGLYYAFFPAANITKQTAKQVGIIEEKK